MMSSGVKRGSSSSPGSGQRLYRPPPSRRQIAPVATATSNGQPAEGKEGKLETAKNLLRDMPEIQSDFKVLLGLFEEVAGKRQITDFNEGELDKLITRLQEMKAAA